MKRNLIISIVGAATLAAVVVGLLLWAVPRHTEPTLMRVCWAGNTAVHLDSVEGAARVECQTPVDLRWQGERVPLAVGVVSPSGAVAASDLRRVENAISECNAQAGFALLRMGSPEQPSSVVVEVGVPAEAGDAPEECEHTREPGTDYAGGATVWLRNVGSDATAHRVLVHALFHAVGLAHDTAEMSVMYPLTPSTTDPAAARLRLTDADRRTLRRLYLRNDP